MLIVSLIAVVGTLCWLVFTFAVYAVPAFVDLSLMPAGTLPPTPQERAVCRLGM